MRISILNIVALIIFASIMAGCIKSHPYMPVSFTEDTSYYSDGKAPVALEAREVPTENKFDGFVHSIVVHAPAGHLRKVFADSNYLHLDAADIMGINQISDLRSAFNLRRPIVKVNSCNDFQIDSLQHSLPFLVPEAAALLHDIGRSFADTIRARCGHEYRIKVTSLLRTEKGVKKLRRRNRNASDTSAHCFATTFDISYSKFQCDSAYLIAQGDLKNTLAEIISKYHEAGRCYVKYEYKQPCFHITVRK